MSGSSHIQSVLIDGDYQNCCRTLNVYLLFAILMGLIRSKLIYLFVTDELASLASALEQFESKAKHCRNFCPRMHPRTKI